MWCHFGGINSSYAYVPLESHQEECAQAVSDPGVLADDERIRRVLRLHPMDEADRISWTELHDALTSMRSHGKAIPRGLGASELDVIDKRVRARVNAATHLWTHTSALLARRIAAPGCVPHRRCS